MEEPNVGPLLRKVVLFSGHMIDAPGRKKTRFPPDKEQVAARAITAALDDLDIGGTNAKRRRSARSTNASERSAMFIVTQTCPTRTSFADGGRRATGNFLWWTGCLCKQSRLDQKSRHRNSWS